MRDNHIPRAERLRRRIAGLEARRDTSKRPMRELTGHRGNPYWGCVGCHRADPQLSSWGHGDRCRYKGLDKEIAYYRRLLADEEGRNDVQHG